MVIDTKVDQMNTSVSHGHEKRALPTQELIENLYAAVDLGSNSFHLVISRYEHGRFVVVDRHRESVRLASGLDVKGNLSNEIRQRAIACLEQFSQLLQLIPTENIRVVGTNAMRRLRDDSDFFTAAETALGTEIEIIAGREEARLIYLGVVKGSELGDEGRIVVDIGGGSTEVIVGARDEPEHRESLEVGCVIISNQFFVDGMLTAERFEKAILHCELAIQPVVRLFKAQGWLHAIGCSGTIRSLSGMLDAMGWANGEITKAALQKLYEHVITAGDVEKVEVTGLNNDRRPVFAGGLSILMAVFELLDIERMQVSDYALRDGVLQDLVGRRTENDARNVAIDALIKRCAVDTRHAEFVRGTALKIYNQVSSSWDIDTQLMKKMLEWSASVHELGMLISHDSYHKHGAYVIQNADMVGFARRDQMLLSSLIRGHRRKFPLRDFERLPASMVTPAKRLAIILRVAVLLHRTRSTPLPQELNASAKGSQLKLSFPNKWLLEHPLTIADLDQEQRWLSSIGIDLKY